MRIPPREHEAMDRKKEKRSPGWRGQPEEHSGRVGSWELFPAQGRERDGGHKDRAPENCQE